MVLCWYLEIAAGLDTSSASEAEIFDDLDNILGRHRDTPFNAHHI